MFCFVLFLKTEIIAINNHCGGSTGDLSQEKKETAKFKIEQLKVSCILFFFSFKFKFIYFNWRLLYNIVLVLPHINTRASLMAQMVKHLPAMQETQGVRSLGREDTLEKEMATHSSTLAWEIPWMEEPGRLQSMGPHWVGYDWATSVSVFCFRTTVI